jgi:hypothetical protein
MRREVLRAQRALTKNILVKKVKTVWARRPGGSLKKIPKPHLLFDAPPDLDGASVWPRDWTRSRPPNFILIVDPEGPRPPFPRVEATWGDLRRKIKMLASWTISTSRRTKSGKPRPSPF